MSIMTGEDAEASHESIRKRVMREAGDWTDPNQTGFSLQELLESAPAKKYNTEDYEYLRSVDQKRRANEMRQNLQLEKELRDFRRAKLKLAVERNKTDIKSESKEVHKPVISKSAISSMVRIKSRNSKKPDT